MYTLTLTNADLELDTPADIFTNTEDDQLYFCHINVICSGEGASGPLNLSFSWRDPETPGTDAFLQQGMQVELSQQYMPQSGFLTFRLKNPSSLRLGVQAEVEVPFTAQLTLAITKATCLSPP
jgi:hypothetical protein